MNQYEVIKGPITLPVGVIVQLSEAQALLREHALRKQKNDIYEVVLPVQFKSGELLSFEDMPDKTLLSAFLPAEKIKEIQAEKLQQSKQEKPAKKPVSESKLKGE